MDKTIIIIRNPRITCNPVNDQLNVEEWCIRLDNITELFMQDGKCFVIFSTRWYNMKGAGSIVDLCAEITVEEFDEIFDAINGVTRISGEELRKAFAHRPNPSTDPTEETINETF